MRRDFARILPSLVLLACSPSTASDDEVAATTAVDESSSTASEDTSEGTSEDTSEGLTFVPEDDSPKVPSCDPFAQDCPAGEKCVPYAEDGAGTWTANKCVPIMGDGAPGEPCWSGGIAEGTDDCNAISMCWNVVEVEGELVGECVQFCKGTADTPECPPNTHCPISGEGSITVCIPTCDPLVQDCGEGLGCFWVNQGFLCVFTAGELSTGEPCGYINDCIPGDFCVDAANLPMCNGAACCTAYCDLQLGDAGCVDQPGTVCTAFFEQGFAPPEHEDLGICILPP